MKTAKAISVRQDGQPDGWSPTAGYRAQVAPDGATRLVISAPPAVLPAVHKALLAVLGARLSVRYLQLTDRAVGQLEKPVSWVGLEFPSQEVYAALDAAPLLVWSDGRHQLWVRGEREDQVVLDELGVLYTYPDDVAFRAALEPFGLPLDSETGLDGRDYVRVQFLSDADRQEVELIARLGLRRVG